jgi:hypothetical protein
MVQNGIGTQLKVFASEAQKDAEKSECYATNGRTTNGSDLMV